MKKIIYLFFFVQLSCVSSVEKNCNCPDVCFEKLSYEKKRKILVDGDREVYTELMMERVFKAPEDVLFYSLIMAHEFNDPAAYYDVYTLTQTALQNVGYGSKYKKIMKNFALPYLLKSAELGNETAQEVIFNLDSTKFE